MTTSQSCQGPSHLPSSNWDFWCFRSRSVGGRQHEILLSRSAVRPHQVPMSHQPTSMAAVLPMADILPLVLEYFARDLVSLCACALVDRNSNRAASMILYRDIIFSPPWAATLDLNEAHKYSVRFYTNVVGKMDTHSLSTHDSNSSDRERYSTPQHSLVTPPM